MKKGFTLVELLAVIVILAIIALIAVPIVLNIINNSKISAAKRSAEIYIDAVDINLTASGLENLEFNIPNGSYDIMKNGDICVGILSNDQCNGNVLNVELKNDNNISGWIYIKNNIIEWYDLEIDNINITMKEYTMEECFKTNDRGYAITEYLCGKNNTYNNPEILDVVVPKTINGKEITEIDWYAFITKQLNSIIYPNTIKTIKEHSGWSNKLTKIIIPNSVTDLGNWVFNSNQLLDEDAFIYKRNSDGSQDKTTVISYGGANRTNVIVPIQVKTLANSSFQHNLIEAITLPEGLEVIEGNAFWNNRLSTLIIPSSVTSIGERAFSGNKLTSVIIKGKSSIEDFESYPDSSPFGWLDGYSDENIIWQP